MKNTFRPLGIITVITKIGFTMAAIIAILLTSCNNISDISTDQPPYGYGRVTINITTGETSRTEFPALNLFDFKYTFFKDGSQTGEEKNPVPDSGGFTFELANGSYTVEVQASPFDDDTKVVASGTSDPFTIGPNGVSTVTVKLSPTNTTTGTGTFQYTITYPANTTLVTLSMFKWSDGSVETENVLGALVDGSGSSNKTKTDTKTVAAGSYVLTVKIEDNVGNYAGLVRAVHIYPSLTTVFNKEFEAKDLIQKYPIINDFNPKYTKISANGFTIVNNPELTLNPNDTGRTIEYAYSTNNSAGQTITWYDSSTISVNTLSEGQTYYIFARAKKNDTTPAGAVATATLTIPTGTLSLLTAMCENCEYDGKNKIVITTGKEVSLNSAVTIPSGVTLDINGTLKITAKDAKFTLNGTMSIKSGGKFEINDLTSSDSSTPLFKVENILSGGTNGNKDTPLLTIESGGKFVFPYTGTIKDTLKNVTGTIVIKQGSQLLLNRMEDGNGTAISGFDSNNLYNFIGTSDNPSTKLDFDYEITAGTFEIVCNSATDVPVFKIPASSKVTVAAGAAHTLSYSSEYHLPTDIVPLNTDLTVEANGELTIAAGKTLMVFAIPPAPGSNNEHPKLTNNGVIRLAGNGSTLMVVEQDTNNLSQYPGWYEGSGKVYKGSDNSTDIASGNNSKHPTWKNDTP